MRSRLGHRVADDAFTACALVSFATGPYLLIAALSGRHAPEAIEITLATATIGATVLSAERLPRALADAWRVLVEEWNGPEPEPPDMLQLPDQTRQMWLGLTKPREDEDEQGC